MEFTIARQPLAQALSQLSRIAADKPTIPATANVMILAHPENWVSFTATNLSIDLRVVLPAQVKASGTITVSAKHLDKWIDGVRGEEVTFKLTEKRLNLKTDKDNSYLSFIEANEFPPIQFTDDQPIAIVSARDLQKGLKQAMVASSTVEARVNLSSVMIEIFAGGEIVMVGLDGVRISKKTLKAQTFGEIKLLISRPFVIELEKVLSSQSGDVTIIANERRAQFIMGNTSFASLLLDVPYVAYEKFFENAEYVTTVDISTKEMLKALNTVRVFAKDDDSPFIEFRTNTTEICMRNDTQVPSEFGTSESTLDATIEGEEWAKDYNAALLVDALTAIDVSTTRLINGIRTGALGEKAITSSFMYLMDSPEDPTFIQIISPRA